MPIWLTFQPILPEFMPSPNRQNRPNLPGLSPPNFFNQENAVFWYLDEIAFLIIPASL